MTLELEVVKDVRHLVGIAESALVAREDRIAAARDTQQLRKERAATFLQSAMEIVLDDPTPANGVMLQEAVEAAKQAGVPAALRVKARKVLDGRNRKEKHARKEVDNVRKLISQLERLSKSGDSLSEDGDEEMDHFPWELSCRRLKAEQKMKQLEQAVEEAFRSNPSSTEVCLVSTEAKDAMTRIRREWCKEEQAEGKLRPFLCLKDAEALEDRIATVREKQEDIGQGARKVAEDLEEKYLKLVKQ
jgi:hypothetical protein